MKYSKEKFLRLGYLLGKGQVGDITGPELVELEKLIRIEYPDAEITSPRDIFLLGNYIVGSEGDEIMNDIKKIKKIIH